MNKRFARYTIATIAALTVTQAPTPVHAAEFKCERWHKLALKAGFKRGDLPTLDYIMYRESRCGPRSIGLNRTATGKVWSSDYGLTQINNFSWITFLRDRKIVRKSSDLLHPLANLRAAKALYDYSKERGNPWRQWNINKK